MEVDDDPAATAEAEAAEEEVSVEALLTWTGDVPAPAAPLAAPSPAAAASPSSASRGPRSARRRAAAPSAANALAQASSVALCGGDDDIPKDSSELPPGVSIRTIEMNSMFHLRCKVDLKSLAMQLRNATYNPRTRQEVVVLRMMEPVMISALIHPNGAVTLPGSKEPADKLRVLARKIARLVQKCGHPEARFEGFRINAYRGVAKLGFPVRLEAVAKKWGRHCMYDPEVTSTLHFYLAEPRATLSVSASGCVSVRSGGPDDAQEALRKIYPLLREFCR